METAFWESFAQNDAEYYILTGNPYPPNTLENKRYFFESGEVFTGTFLSDVTHMLDYEGTVCEIGCGVGRLLLPHARLFNRAVGVDISKTMLNKLKENASNINVNNIQSYLSTESWHINKFSYVYSRIVFQHIADISIIEDYIIKIGDALVKNGIAKLHFDTRPEQISYRLRNLLPDFILPRIHRLGIRRIRRNSDQLKGLFVKAGLTLINETSPNSINHVFVLKKI